MTYQDLCEDCGRKKYTIIREHFLRGITVALRACKGCGKEAGIIPAEDWQNACRKDRDVMLAEWD